jgi:hypothetical protein
MEKQSVNKNEWKQSEIKCKTIGANKRRLFRTAATSIVVKMNVEIIFHNRYSMNSRAKITTQKLLTESFHLNFILATIT